MKFVSLPDNGSSWRGRLLYGFTTEETEPQDVMVEIIDAMSSSRLGAMRLYGVTDAEVDIASYIRPRLSLMPVNVNRRLELISSPSAIAVIVRINGVESETRVFFRSQFDYSAVGPLSSHAMTGEVVFGEAIRLTLFAKSEISVSVTCTGGKGLTMRASEVTHGMPMELIIPTSVSVGVETIHISLRFDNSVSILYNYVVIPNTGKLKRLMWFNSIGGVESFVFDHSKRISYSVERSDMNQCGEGVKSAEGVLKYRLCTGYELPAEMERVAQILLSPVVYREVDGECRRVDILSRDIAFDSKGMLCSIVLDISEKWEGGKAIW